MTYQRLKTVTQSFSMAMAVWIPVVSVFCLLFGSLSLQAQLTTGSFSGTVQDQSGAIISGATVVLHNQTTADNRKTVSNDRGVFTFAGVIPGDYSVAVEAKGFKSWKQADLTLSAGDSRNIAGIKMEIGSASESVVVESGSLEIVPTDNGERSALLSEHDISRLSVESRNLSELFKVLPGVTTVANGIGNGTQFDFLTTVGATGSTIGVGLSPNGAPYRGGTAYILDGANIIDPGCNCWSIATINPDMTEEVKIQTANFGADSADGPVIMNSISKAGGSSYHGQAYMYTRNGVLNSNYWQNNHAGSPRTQDAYYYPGGNFGGPVRLPHSDFNKNNKLLFWGGYEYQYQNPGGSTILKSYVPGADMRNGNFSLNNTTDTSNLDSNAALCPGGFSPTATNWCNDLSGGYDSTGAPITNPSSIPVDPGAKALMSLFPAANVNPATNSGYNYYKAMGGLSNVYIYRFRVDYNLSENTKAFVAFQQGSSSSPAPAHLWSTPTNGVPFPGGQLNNVTTSRVLTGNLLSILTPTLTNEFIGAWGWVNSPTVPTNIKASYSSAIGYSYGTVFNSSLVAPGIFSPGSQTFPEMAQADVWSASNGAYPEKKATPSFSDNVTKVYKTHTFKFGAFTELVNNYQGSYENLNGEFAFNSAIQADPFNHGTLIGTNNPTANLVMGIAGNNPTKGEAAFSQTSSDPLSNMAYRTTSAFAMDDWKLTPRFTANIGLRFDHLGRWYDRAGEGLAVWIPGRYLSDVTEGKSYPGVSWHGIEPGIPNSGSPVQAVFTSPRLGFAYDIFGKGNTVLRGGWGEYRWNDQYNDYAGPVTTAASMKSYSTPSGNVTFAEIGAEANILAKQATEASAVNVADPNDRQDAATYAYNFTISQQMPWRTLLEVAYVGNQTENLLMGGQNSGAAIGGGSSGYSNQNKIAVGGVFKKDPVTGAAAPTDPDNQSTYNLTDYYPYQAGYGQNSITMNTHNGYSNYNGIQAAWTKQTGRLSFNLNYTYSKSLGILNNSVDAFTVHGNYGVLSIDRPQVITTSYAYSLGQLYKGNYKIVGGAANGWTVTGVTTWQAGGNLQANFAQNMGMTINDSATNNNVTTLSYYGTNTGDIQPITTCNPKSGLGSHQLVNMLCLAPPALGVYGQRQIGYLGGPSYFNSDLTLFKTFHLGERHSVEFKAAAFNFLNHPLWEYSTSSIITPTFTTTNKANFTSTMVAPLAASGLTQGTLDQKSGRRLGELSVKYNF
jgi:hypothetical protein